MDLRDDLLEAVSGRARLVGVGNVDQGDDGLGPLLARALAREGLDAIDAGTAPENILSDIVAGGVEDVLFLDAADIGAAPGSVVLLDSGAMRARFPQVSTHKISLGTLARLIEAGSGARVRLLGVQPLALRPGEGLSQPVRETLEMLTRMIIAAAPAGRRS